MAAAAAPLRISTDAMSAGLMSDARFGAVVPASGFISVEYVELSIGTPSTTNSGWPVPVIVLGPRMRMYDDEPGSPDDELTSTFGALPASADTTFDSLDREMSDVSTVLMTLPNFSRVVDVPSPVTTTSPNRSGLASSTKFSACAPGVIAMATAFS